MGIFPRGVHSRQDDPRARAAASWRIAGLQRQTPLQFLTVEERLERIEERLGRLEAEVRRGRR